MRSSSSRASASSRPIRSSRTIVQSYYEESDPEDEFDERIEPLMEVKSLGVTTASLRPRRSSRMPASYREDSTDESLDEYVGSPESPSSTVQPVVSIPPARSERSGVGASSRRRREPTTRRSTRSTNKRTLELGKPLRQRQSKHQKVEYDDPAIVGSGVIPPWQTLPYYILFDIMFYASRPLVDKKAGIRLKSVQWLVDVALLCRSFHEPALSALYYSPPLIPAARCHGLLNLLCRSQETLSTNYSNKIKVLHVDVESVLLHKGSRMLGHFELHKLIDKTPLLKELRLYHRNDYIVGLPRWQTPQSKWTYPESIFSSLNSSMIRLQSWDWNGRFMETNELLPFMHAVHQQRAFQSLREVRILHLGGHIVYGESNPFTHEGEMAVVAALSELRELQRLEFRESSFVNGQLLTRLSSNLTSLTVANCDGLNAADLAFFLDYRGGNLRELCLNYNRSLNLSFLQGLARWCKSLERLNVDLSIHDWSSYHDVEPHFQALLEHDETPTWPSTLQEIEFVQLQKWDDKAAEVFFTSLIESAPTLPNLRRLVLSAILKVGWRDRARLREKWIGNLETVFLRRSEPPDPTLNTIPHAGGHDVEDNMNTDNQAGKETDNAQSTPSKRKSARLAQQKAPEPEESAQQCDIGSARSRSPSLSIPIQGMCDVVRVRIDNQRPAETQFNESDFLDDEQSGDEDWNGEDYVPGTW